MSFSVLQDPHSAATRKPGLLRISPAETIALACLGIYYILFILKTTTVIDGVRYFVLFDDALVSMNYARTFAHGHGLVYFPGAPRVEGFSNPLWTLFMAAIHTLPISPARICGAVQITTAICLLLNAYFASQSIRLITGSSGAGYAGLLLTGFYHPIVNWSLQGMEVAPLLLLYTVAVYVLLRSRTLGRFPYGLYGILIPAMLLRMDAAAGSLVLCIWAAFSDRKNINRHLLFAAAAFAVALGSQTLFRRIYYDEWMPNTYFLKLTGTPISIRVTTGLMSFRYLVNDFGLPIFITTLASAIFRGTREIRGMAVLFLVHCGYSVYIGGDAWDYRTGTNRFVTSSATQFICCFVWTCLQAANFLRSRYAGIGGAFRVTTFKLTVGCLALVTAWNAYKGTESLKESCLSAKPLFIGQLHDNLRAALELKKTTKPDAQIACVWAGVFPYFSERPAVDLLGKNDKVIARLPNNPNALRMYGHYYPGHMKWNYDYSIGNLAPDVIAQVWFPGAGEMEQLIAPYYEPFTVAGSQMYFRRDSDKIARVSTP